MKVGILGATGLVGQRFIQLLDGHPWFKIAVVAASEKSAGKIYGEAAHWMLSPEPPKAVADLEVMPVNVKALEDVDFVFSALPSDVAGKVEEDFANAGHIVVSDTSAHRIDPDVPVLIPEVNPEHLSLIEKQRKNRNWKGAIVANPNCTTNVLDISLKPIFDKFGLRSVVVSTMQALSGAGFPGVASMQITENVIPYIEKEEEKIQVESFKILGTPTEPAKFKLSASCNRVSTLDGHLEAVFVDTLKNANPEDIAEAMESFIGLPQKLKLPTAPKKPIILRKEADRPQPRLDRDAGRGMSVVVGRIRKDPVFNGVKYMVLGHNTIRGAAGNAILSAELLKAKKIM